MSVKLQATQDACPQFHIWLESTNAFERQPLTHFWNRDAQANWLETGENGKDP